MPNTRIILLLDAHLLDEVDALVRQGRYRTRSQCIGHAVREKIQRMKMARLAEQCALLDPAEERALAEEGLADALTDWVY
jgi:metal-responsive CopG/Arc/MetJ family transcriptional regulator